MGVHPALIAAADSCTGVDTRREDTAWRHGKACSAAAFLSLSSRLASALISGFFILHRILAHPAPDPELRVAKRSAHVLLSGAAFSQATSMTLPLYQGDVTAGHRLTLSVMTSLNGLGCLW